MLVTILNFKLVLHEPKNNRVNFNLIVKLTTWTFKFAKYIFDCGYDLKQKVGFSFFITNIPLNVEGEIPEKSGKILSNFFLKLDHFFTIGNPQKLPKDDKLALGKVNFCLHRCQTLPQSAQWQHNTRNFGCNFCLDMV